MQKFISVVILLVSSYVPAVMAADAEVTITAPVAGAKLSSSAKIKVSYQTTPGPQDNHVHLYVDDKAPVQLAQLNGHHTLEPLTAGKHGICIRLVDRQHVETGTQDCVMFRVE